MLAYLKCVHLPKTDEKPEIQVFSRTGGCLAFKSSKKLEAGVSSVLLSSSRKSATIEVDVYHYDERYEMYEGRLVSAPRVEAVNTSSESAPEKIGLYGEVTETLVGGAKVTADRPLKAGTVLRLEFNDKTSLEDQSTHLAEVMWAKPNADSSYEIRLRYQDESYLKELVSRN